MEFIFKNTPAVNIISDCTASITSQVPIKRIDRHKLSQGLVVMGLNLAAIFCNCICHNPHKPAKMKGFRFGVEGGSECHRSDFFPRYAIEIPQTGSNMRETQSRPSSQLFHKIADEVYFGCFLCVYNDNVAAPELRGEFI